MKSTLLVKTFGLDLTVSLLDQFRKDLVKHGFNLTSFEGLQEQCDPNQYMLDAFAILDDHTSFDACSEDAWALYNEFSKMYDQQVENGWKEVDELLAVSARDEKFKNELFNHVTKNVVSDFIVMYTADGNEFRPFSEMMKDSDPHKYLVDATRHLFDGLINELTIGLYDGIIGLIDQRFFEEYGHGALEHKSFVASLETEGLKLLNGKVVTTCGEELTPQQYYFTLYTSAKHNYKVYVTTAFDVEVAYLSDC